MSRAKANGSFKPKRRRSIETEFRSVEDLIRNAASLAAAGKLDDAIIVVEEAMDHLKFVRDKIDEKLGPSTDDRKP